MNAQRAFLIEPKGCPEGSFHFVEVHIWASANICRSHGPRKLSNVGAELRQHSNVVEQFLTLSGMLKFGRVDAHRPANVPLLMKGFN